jgi:hypothetical protein
MKATAGVLIVAALAFGSGCARTDWIERTLVTVDVTGTWDGNVGGGPSRGLRFQLEQEGSTVKGSMDLIGAAGNSRTAVSSRAIDGTVAGDVFRFRQRFGTVQGEVTVSGDEMTGQVWLAGALRPISLRRVDPASRPGSQPR